MQRMPWDVRPWRVWSRVKGTQSARGVPGLARYGDEMLNAGPPRSWQTVDPSFMTPSRLNTLRLLVEDRHVSLYTLNAPQESMNGVTPLGFAAWINSPKAVEILLEASGGAVSVDGRDAYGVTPLMCKWDSPSIQASELRSNDFTKMRPVTAIWKLSIAW